MSKYKELMEQLNAASKQKQEELLNEQYLIVIKIPSQPNTLRLTYASYKKGRIIQIDELDAADKLISTSEFKGKGCEGFCSSDIKDMKVLLNQLKPKDFKDNKEIVVEEYFKQN